MNMEEKTNIGREKQTRAAESEQKFRDEEG
jgi:hypothetical protein